MKDNREEVREEEKKNLDKLILMNSLKLVIVLIICLRFFLNPKKSFNHHIMDGFKNQLIIKTNN